MNRWGWQVVLRAIVGVALTGLAAAGQGETPPPNPVVEHYKAYTAALQRQDFATAETEAAAALEASVQAYGDEGRTAVLALNLADVRLVRGNLDAAVAPAQKALALAEARGSASGVDARLARLTLDRAQLHSGGPFALNLAVGEGGGRTVGLSHGPRILHRSPVPVPVAALFNSARTGPK